MARVPNKRFVISLGYTQLFTLHFVGTEDEYCVQRSDEDEELEGYSGYVNHVLSVLDAMFGRHRALHQ